MYGKGIIIMDLTPLEKARKGEDGWIRSKERIKQNYEDIVDTLGDKIIAAKDTTKANFATAIDDPDFDERVQAGCTLAVAGASQKRGVDDRAAAGFTPTQRNRSADDIETKEHLASITPGVILVATGATGKLTILPGASTSLQTQIIVQALNKYVVRFSPSTTVAQAEQVLIDNIADIDNLSLGA